MSNDGRVPVNNIVRKSSNEIAAGISALQPPHSPVITLLDPDPAFWRFVSNLTACISAPPRGVSPMAWMCSPMFRSAFLRPGDPSRGLLLSALLHVLVFTAILSEPLYDFGIARKLFPLEENLPSNREVIYYTKADLLPFISPPKSKAPERPATHAAPSRVAVKPAFQPAQRIVSKPPTPDNRRQTIMQPEVPQLRALAEVRVPNMIRWSAPNLPAPLVPTEIRLAAPKPAPEPLPAPVERVMPSLPLPKSLRADANAMPLVPVATVKAPRLPVPVRIARVEPPALAPVARRIIVGTAPVVPGTPAPPAGGFESISSQQIHLASLIAISVAPAPPVEDVVIPMGSRSGEFAASPDGRGEESAGIPFAGDALAAPGTGEGTLPREESAEIHVPSLSITGRGLSSGPSSFGGTDQATDLRRLMASLSRPKLIQGPVPGQDTASEKRLEAGKDRRLESEFFGVRRVYTVYMNMPNLTSAAGSWVLRFAELNRGSVPQAGDGELLTPEAIRKVDPMYVASAARERVQGTVTLAAVVLKDGTLANIRVVGSLDPRLDTSAVAALTQWRFHPARKNGSPIDLDVLVQIPFRISSL